MDGVALPDSPTWPTCQPIPVVAAPLVERRARATQASSQGSASSQQGGEDGGSPLERACARAAADFWVRLRSFAALGVPRRGWGQVGPNHPVLSVVDGRLRVAQLVVFDAQEAAD